LKKNPHSWNPARLMVLIKQGGGKVNSRIGF